MIMLSHRTNLLDVSTLSRDRTFPFLVCQHKLLAQALAFTAQACILLELGQFTINFA